MHSRETEIFHHPPAYVTDSSLMYINIALYLGSAVTMIFMHRPDAECLLHVNGTRQQVFMLASHVANPRKH